MQRGYASRERVVLGPHLRTARRRVDQVAGTQQLGGKGCSFGGKGPSQQQHGGNFPSQHMQGGKGSYPQNPGNGFGAYDSPSRTCGHGDEV